MIGFLRGIVVHKQPPSLMLDVNGVGYELQAPMSTFYALPENDQAIALYTHMAIRDDAHVLYAFVDLADRALFQSLLKVSGVGGKMALAILSNMSSNEFIQAVHQGNLAGLTRIPGVGKKTAERLVIEMRDRLPKLEDQPVKAVPTSSPGIVQQANTAFDDALGALLALGYKQAEAQRMLKAVDHADMTTEEIIRHALKQGR